MQRLFILFIIPFFCVLSWASNSPELSNVSATTPSEQKLLNAAMRLDKPLPQIEQELTQLIQAARDSEQNANNHLANLQAQNAQLRTRLSQLDQQVANISQQKDHSIQPIPSHQPIAQNNKKWQPHADLSFGQKIFLLWNIHFVAGLVILVLLILVWFVGSEPKNKKNEEDSINNANAKDKLQTDEVPEDSDLQQEYDFMGSDEAIPAKLDLARAYIDMGDHDSAHDVLQDVLNKGDEHQRQQAQELLRQIKF